MVSVSVVILSVRDLTMGPLDKRLYYHVRYETDHKINLVFWESGTKSRTMTGVYRILFPVLRGNFFDCDKGLNFNKDFYKKIVIWVLCNV